MSKLRLWRLIRARLGIILFHLMKGRFKMARNTLWVSLFTTDSGAGLARTLYRTFPGLLPQSIEVETTTRCHLKCTMCEHTYWKNEKNLDMSLEQFKALVDQFPRLKWIGLTGIGSSFLNRDFPAMLRYLKSKSIYVEFFDTFTLIDRKMASELVEMGIDKVYVSMDAATRETYEKIRVGASFDRVLANVKGLLEAKRERKMPIPEVWFHFVVTKENVSEMPQYVELVKSLKGDDRGGTLIYWSSLLDFGEVKDLVVREIPQGILQETERRAKRLGIEMAWNFNWVPCKPITACVPHEPMILVSGHVQPCCATGELNSRDFQREFSLGNLFETPFSVIWDTTFKELRQKVRRGEVPDICRHCRSYNLSSAANRKRR